VLQNKQFYFGSQRIQRPKNEIIEKIMLRLLLSILNHWGTSHRHILQEDIIMHTICSTNVCAKTT